ncbi:MAG: hypothetical protein EOQ56_08485 [Mesorhizobium sp.]|nr:MAG: hypothetical protein EOQ56_08485 [Mesorhizobium sp.]
MLHCQCGQRLERFGHPGPQAPRRPHGQRVVVEALGLIQPATAAGELTQEIDGLSPQPGIANRFSLSLGGGEGFRRRRLVAQGEVGGPENVEPLGDVNWHPEGTQQIDEPRDHVAG